MTVTTWQHFRRRGLIWLGLGAAAEPTWAHHAMEGRIPANVFEGLLSGFAHPVIGLDHFAFVIAIGLLAMNAKGRYGIPAAFVFATVAGTGLHLASINLAGAEIAVALSLVIAGGMLIWKQWSGRFLALMLGATAGVFHGYAYGESIVGAQSGPLAAYLLGFALIQYLIAAAVIWFGGRWNRSESFPARSPLVLRATGSIVGLIGIGFMALNI